MIYSINAIIHIIYMYSYHMVGDMCIHQGIVSPLFNHQFTVSALLSYLPILNNRYHVCILDGGQVVGDDDAGPAKTGIIQGLLDNLGKGGRVYA